MSQFLTVKLNKRVCTFIPQKGSRYIQSSHVTNAPISTYVFRQPSSIPITRRFEGEEAPHKVKKEMVQMQKRCLQTYLKPFPFFNGNHMEKERILHKPIQANNMTLIHLPLKSNQYRLLQKRNQVFVSKHNDLNLSIHDISSFCQAHGMAEDHDLRTTTTHVIIRECPFCHPIKGKTDNMYKLYIQLGSGAYFCHRCAAQGSWYDFKMKLGGYQIKDTTGNQVNTGGVQRSSNSFHPSRFQERNKNQHTSNQWNSKSTKFDPDEMIQGASREKNQNRISSNNNHCSPMPNPKLAAVYISNLYVEETSKDVNPATQEKSTKAEKSNPKTSPNTDVTAIDYLTNVRGLNRQTLRKYGVGRAIYKFRGDGSQNHQFVSAECVTFPWIMRASEVQEQEALRGNSYSWQRDNGDIEINIEDEKSNGTKNKSLDNVKIEEGKMEADDAKDHVPSEENRKNLNKEFGPWVTRRIKARALQKKSWQRLDPPGGGWGLFGWHTIPHDATEVIMTEGEYDAMAVYQATGRPCISLPNGCRNLPVEVLPMLERFHTIYLWMDNDGPGREGAEAFAKKLGLRRALLVQPTGANAPKDANEALLKGLDLEAILNEAKVVPHERILNFSDLRTQVMHEIFHPDEYAGVKVPSLPKFSNIIKGFRRGEMTVVTGATGSGKTTFLGQISLDFAEQGINTLWGSFEIKNTRLMHKLLQQFSRNPIPKGDPNAAEIVESVADKFGNLPLYFMSFHGGSDVDDVLDAMDYAVYVHDVEHIILDNMQFMLSRTHASRQGSVYDKFDMQDIAVEKFRKFSTERNVHVTLVVHPRKEDEGSKLGISSIYGSAKSTQEADTVLILQNDGRLKYMDVRKNRFDGALGASPLFFQHKSGRYSEVPDGSQQAQMSQNKKVKAPPPPVKQQQVVNVNYSTLDPGPHKY